MSHSTVRIIRREHASLAAMFHAIVQLLEQHREAGTLPDFATVRAMLLYLNEFPERRHFRKEHDLLLPRLRARTTCSVALLDRLENDRAVAEIRIRDVEHALLTFEMLGQDRRSALEKAVFAYADFHLRRMALEEAVILPMAEQLLTADDWRDLDEAFGRNEEPANEYAKDYESLFTRVVNHAPSPMRSS